MNYLKMCTLNMFIYLAGKSEFIIVIYICLYSFAELSGSAMIIPKRTGHLQLEGTGDVLCMFLQ